jgi:hypothetical protein
VEGEKGAIQMKWEEYDAMFANGQELGSVVAFIENGVTKFGELLEVNSLAQDEDLNGLTVKDLSGFSRMVKVENVTMVYRLPSNTQQLSAALAETQAIIDEQLVIFKPGYADKGTMAVAKRKIDKAVEIARLMLRAYGNWNILDTADRMM